MGFIALERDFGDHVDRCCPSSGISSADWNIRSFSSQAECRRLIQPLDIINRPCQDILGSLSVERPVDLLNLLRGELRREDVAVVTDGHV